MRNLAQGNYTHAQVLERLHDPNMRFRASFDVLDESRLKVGELTTVSAVPRDALVEHNVDRAVMGSLDLTMGSDDQLRGFAYRRYIKPWQHYEMRDGGWVKYPWGVYVWTVPDVDQPGRPTTGFKGGTRAPLRATFPQTGEQEWKIVLPDQLDIFNTQGPDENEGFTVFQGQLITDAIKDVHLRCGITDLSGITESPIAFDQTKTWLFLKPNTPEQKELDQIPSQLAKATGLAAAMYQQRLLDLAAQGVVPTTDGQVTWLSILNELYQSLAYWPPHFDWDGTSIATTALDPTKIVPDPSLVYVSDDRSILSEPKTSVDLSKFANKVVVRSTNPDGLYDQVTADADQWMPDHPLSHRITGRYVPHMQDETNVDNIVALAAKAVLQLFYMLCTYDKSQFISHVNPCHEPYDFYGLQVINDPDLARARGDSTFQAVLQPLLDYLNVQLPVATVPVYQEHMVSVDLNTVDQDHGGYRVYLPLQGFG